MNAAAADSGILIGEPALMRIFRNPGYCYKRLPSRIPGELHWIMQLHAPPQPDPEDLTWGGETLTWGGSPLQW